MNWIGLDIGGANLKLADGHGLAVSQRFPLWKHPDLLADAIRALLGFAASAPALAVTMTGELADCFATKRQGVEAILEAVVAAAPKRRLRVYLTDGSFVSCDAARQQPLLASSSNWHALARFAGWYVPRGNGLLIDIGSTTCDIIPLVNSQPAARGRTDSERLVHGELAYTGVERSPVCALVEWLPWQGQRCPVAQEVFATTQDAYLISGDLPNEPNSLETPDGRPATRENALDRLARMICADQEMFDAQDAEAAATAIAEAQLAKVATALQRVLACMATPPATIVISGQGEFLARRAVDRVGLTAVVISLAERLGTDLSRCATAHALAVLAERVNPR